MKKLFLAHHPQAEFIKENCNHYYCNVLSIATMESSPEHVTPPFSHSHEEYEVVIPLTPIPVLVIEGAVYFGEVGYAYPVNSKELHGCKFSVSDIAHDHIVIQKEFMELFMQKFGVNHLSFNAKFEVIDELKCYIEFFKRNFNRQEKYREIKLEQLAGLICSTIIEQGLIRHDMRQWREISKYKKMREIATYINTHFHQSLELGELAYMAGYSKEYFISAFKSELGETPYSYITKLRISKAKVLLETTDMSIKEISENCGFQKINTFSSIFKRTTHMTPQAYKIKIKKILWN